MTETTLQPTDKNRLREELFATRQELARRRIEEQTGMADLIDQFSYIPERNEAFARLATLDSETLEIHIERLKRDIESLDQPTRQDSDVTVGRSE